MYQAPLMARKPFVVNAAVREKVRHLAGRGVPQDDINGRDPELVQAPQDVRESLERRR